LLHLVGYLYNWQMGFNSVFKGLNIVPSIHGQLEATSVCFSVPPSPRELPDTGECSFQSYKELLLHRLTRSAATYSDKCVP
jgi:hypothetical protein